ncbi:MAG: hypothetical protein E2O53_03855 [Gammaproteobacteria bacterium]|nr:MAG: hypothetical protein E2O53_03855 [Gammaproteobacteria bacterium]
MRTCPERPTMSKQDSSCHSSCQEIQLHQETSIRLHGIVGECPGVDRKLREVRKMTEDWMVRYNNERAHDSLNDMMPVEFLQAL